MSSSRTVASIAVALSTVAGVAAAARISSAQSTEEPPPGAVIPPEEHPVDVRTVSSRLDAPWRARLGPQLGVRVGYGVGTGVVYSGLPVSDASHGALPVILDAGWRFIPQLYLGLYGQAAPVFTRNNPVSCPGDASCPAQDWRFGVEADVHVAPHALLDPYFGIGTCYEILHTHLTVPISAPTPNGPVPANATAGIVDRGWEFASLTLGFDARLCSVLGVGPFVTGSLGEYGVHTGTLTTSVAGTPVESGPLPAVHHAAHELFIFGVRGTVNP